MKPLCKASLRLCTKTILSWTLQSGVPKAPGMPLGYNNIALTFVVHSLIIGFVVNGLHYWISSHGTLDSIFWNPFGWYDFWSTHLWICITIMMFCNFKNVSKWKQNCIIVLLVNILWHNFGINLIPVKKCFTHFIFKFTQWSGLCKLKPFTYKLKLSRVFPFRAQIMILFVTYELISHYLSIQSRGYVYLLK